MLPFSPFTILFSFLLALCGSVIFFLFVFSFIFLVQLLFPLCYFKSTCFLFPLYPSVFFSFGPLRLCSFFSSSVFSFFCFFLVQLLVFFFPFVILSLTCFLFLPLPSCSFLFCCPFVYLLLPLFWFLPCSIVLCFVFLCHLKSTCFLFPLYTVPLSSFSLFLPSFGFLYIFLLVLFFYSYLSFSPPCYPKSGCFPLSLLPLFYSVFVGCSFVFVLCLPFFLCLFPSSVS